MNRKIFEQEYKKRERLWEALWITSLIAIISMSGWIGWIYGDVITVVLSAVIGAMIGMNIICLLEKFLGGTYLKRYWIEDHGDIIKLYGSVKINGDDHAKRNLLAVKPDYKLVDDAFEKFGCTLAAVKATNEDIKAKKEFEKLGLNLSSVS